jgi:hypothetical protein
VGARNSCRYYDVTPASGAASRGIPIIQDTPAGIIPPVPGLNHFAGEYKFRELLKTILLTHQIERLLLPAFGAHYQ